MIDFLSKITGDLASDIGIYIGLATTAAGALAMCIKKIRDAVVDFIVSVKEAFKSKGKDKSKE